ncbi:Hypothetical protein CAP_4404 [Chondromyces apiculatus DSM 436]|uniref:Uncharacterized protein n=1 Tax=Chondromyces apiculatus DSM 436 TaxID=1192034 RepID=A0A017T5W3_9BACT|nr:Hypothetical protein CAP_4404 [Chondromyces apiculatus DSM 436]
MRLRQAGDACVADHHALGGARRARGVDHVRRVLRQHHSVGVPVGLLHQRRARGNVVHHQPGRGVTGQGSRGRLVAGQQQRRTGVCQHEGDPRGRVLRIYRQVRRSCLQHGHDRDHQLRRTRQRQRHDLLGAHPSRTQHVRQPVGAGVQLRVRQPLVLEHQRHCSRGCLDLRLEQDGERGRDHRLRRGVARHQQFVALLRREQRDAADRLVGVGHGCLQQAYPAREQRFDRAEIEAIGGVFEVAAEALRATVRATQLGETEAQVELGRARAGRHDRDLEAGEIERARRNVLHRQEHLEERMMCQRSGRVEDLDQVLERHVLVGVRAERRLAHPAEELPEGGVARGVGAQHQGVHEEADEIFQRPVHAPGDGGAEGDVAPRPEPREQRRQASLQHHEQAGAALTGELRQTPVQACIERDRQEVAPEGGDRWAGPVGGQFDLLGQVGQGPGPVEELTAEQAGGIGLVTQQGALPQRVIGVLDRQRRPRRSLAPAPGPVCGRDVARQRGQGRAVAGDVVKQEQQHVLRGGQREQRDAQRKLAGEVEPVLRGRPEGLRQVSLGGEGDGQREAGFPGGQDQLAGGVVDLGEHRPQALVAGHHVAERRFQRRAIQRPGEAERHRDVVRGGVALHLVQEPQAPLRERQREIVRACLHAQREPHVLGVAPVQVLREPGDRGSLEEPAHAQLDAERNPDPADELRGEQRVPAQLEEVVVDADAGQVERLGEQVAEELLAGRSRCPASAEEAEVGSRQRLAIELAVPGQGQGVEHDERCRHHVVRQAAGEPVAQRSGLGGRARGGDGVGDQPLLTRAILAEDNGGVRDLGVRRERGLDLAELDAVAADLHLRVDAAAELKVTPGGPPGAVAGAVHPLAAAKRAGEEALRGQAGAAQVAPRQAGSGDVQLSDDARRHRLQARVEHVHLGVDDRPPDRRRVRHRRQGLAQGRAHRGLGRTVGVDHPPPCGPGGHQVRRAGLASDDQGHAGGQAVSRGHHRQRGGRQGRVGDLLPGRQRGQRRAWQELLLRRQHQRRAGEEAHAQVPERGVEARRGELQHAAARAHPEACDVRRRQAGDARVADHHALGGARRARGVDHVRRVLRQRHSVGVPAGLLRQHCARGSAVHHQPGDGEARQGSRRRLAAGQQQRRTGVCQHEGDPRGRVLRIHRQVRRTCLQHRQDGDHQLRRAWQRQGDDVLGPHPFGEQPVRQPVGAGVQLRVRQLLVLEHQRHRAGRRLHLRLEEGRERDDIDRLRRVVARDQQLVALLRRHQPDVADRLVGVGHGRLQEPGPAGHHRLDGGRVEQIAAVLDGALDAEERAVLSAPL